MAPAYTPFLFPLSELISVSLSQFFLLRGWNTSAAPNCLLFVFASPGLIEALQTSTKGAFIARGPGNSSPGAGPSFSHRAFAHSLHTACSSPRSFGGGALTLTKAPTQRDIPRLSSQNLHPPPIPHSLSLLYLFSVIPSDKVSYLSCLWSTHRPPLLCRVQEVRNFFPLCSVLDPQCPANSKYSITIYPQNGMSSPSMEVFKLSLDDLSAPVLT